MRSRLILGFSVLLAATVLAACGDAGDHFLEFRCTASCPTSTPSPSGKPTKSPTNSATVASLKISLPSIPNAQSAGTYALNVLAYTSNGQVIAPNTKLTSSITIASNSGCNVTFTSGTASGTSILLNRAPLSVSFAYTPPSSSCTAPPVISLTASSATAKPQSVDVSFAGENSAASITLSMIATPDPSSNGIYPLTISAKDAKGKAIPPGTILANPIQVTSNATCVTTFGTVAGGPLTPGLSVTATGTIFLSYDPENASASCPAPQKVVVTAIATGSSAGTFTFSAAATSATAKVDKISLHLTTKPKLQSAGTFPLIFNAYVANGKQIPPGTTLSRPITLTSNSSCSITFNTPTGSGTSLTLSSVPEALTISYSPPSAGCAPPAEVEVDAFSPTAKPSSVSLAVVGGTATVGSLALSMLSPPSASTYGIYPFFVTAKDSKGKTIANGTPLSNPIQLSSDAACVTSFGTSASSLGTSLTLNSALSQIYLSYNPALDTASCPAPKKIQIVATASKASSGSYAFTGAAPTPTPSTTTVSRVSLTMPSTPNPLSPGTFSLVVTAFNSGGKAVAPGTPFKNSINLTSNSSCSVSYTSGGITGPAIQLASAPSNVTLNYTPASDGCSPPGEVILSAFDLDAKPQSSTFSLLGGTSTVASITLTMLTKPDPSTVGTYPLFVTAKDSSGNTIPYGQTLTNSILFSSNLSCGTMFGTSPAGNFSPLYSMTNSTSQIYVQFDPTIGSTCPSPSTGTVVVTAIAPTGTSGTISATFNWPF